MVLLMPFCSLFYGCFVIMFFLSFSFSLFLCDLILSCSGVLELLSGDFLCVLHLNAPAYDELMSRGLSKLEKNYAKITYIR